MSQLVLKPKLKTKTIFSSLFILLLLLGTYVYYVSFVITTELTPSVQILLNEQVNNLTADEVISGSSKRSPSYNPEYGKYTRSQLEQLAKQGDKVARKMKKLFDQSKKRLLEKNKTPKK